MSAASTQLWWAALEKSNLLSAEQLANVRSDPALDSLGSKGLAERLVQKGLITRWQADQLLAGRTSLYLGRYLLEKRIGKGGMGAVYRAKHTVMGRSVALKVMSPALLSDANAVARFRREVEAAAKLNHPNIVSAYDADCVGKTHFLVMEFIDGPDLKDWFTAHAPLPIPWVCECIRQAAVGLQHAHEHGMVHRDLKPSNLLVTSDKATGRPVVKILDMGLARFVSSIKDEEGLTQSGQIMGTPDYIAPEQAEDTKRADIRSDIFSLGCTMYYLLTGQLPFPGESLMAKLMSRVQGTAPLIRTIRAEVPGGLEALIARMLAADPKNRPQTPEEVAKVLAPFASSVDEGMTETIAMPAPAETPTVTSPGGRQESDAGLGDFLANLASQPAHHGRYKNLSRNPEVAEATSSPSRADSSGSLVASRPRIPKTAMMVGAVISVLAIGVLGTLVFFRGGSASTAQTPAEFPGGQPVSSDAGATVPPAAENPPNAGEASHPVGESGSSNNKAPEAAAKTATQTATETATNSPAKESPSQAPLPGTAEATSSAIPGNDPSSVQPTAPVGPATATVSPTPTRAPQIHVVGVEPGQLPDLKRALALAGPGDTILIRHRGPLEFDPTDLNGKSPLTIAGDTDRASGKDYWPVIRQAQPNLSPAAPADKTGASTGAPALFHAPKLNISLRKLHLAAGGPNRAKIAALFACDSGRVEIEQCTVTVGTPGPGMPVEDPVSLVRTAGSDEPLTVLLNNTLLRGLPLQSCVHGESANQISVQASQSVWSGGSAPWIVARELRGPLGLTLRNCTVYNIPSLVDFESHEPPGAGVSLLEAQVEKCLFVGPYANQEPLIAWNRAIAGSDFTRAVSDGGARWWGAGNVFHRYESYYNASDPRKQQSIEVWRKLWSQTGTDSARQADPMFRVWPDGYELQESLARDFEPRFGRSKARGQNIEADVGADVARLPHALVNLFVRPLPKETAGVPRGEPRILRVHQREGPYKTLESAFADVVDDEIIEIADGAVYVPKRNFATQPGTGVIVYDNRNLTIRSGSDQRPTIVLDEAAQSSIPNVPLILFDSLRNESAVHLEGLDFRYNVGKRQCTLISHLQRAGSVRINDCTFVDPFEDRQGQLGPSFATAICRSGGYYVWFENNVVARANRKFNVIQYGGEHTIARNCLIEGTFADFPRGGNAATAVRMERCTVLGGEVITAERKNSSARAEVIDTLAIGENLLLVASTDMLNLVHWRGSRNILIGTSSYAAASKVPLLRTFADWSQLWGEQGSVKETNRIPQFEPASPRGDAYASYRLRRGQPAATMATDGGPVGVRFEYLPELTVRR